VGLHKQRAHPHQRRQQVSINFCIDVWHHIPLFIMLAGMDLIGVYTGAATSPARISDSLCLMLCCLPWSNVWCASHAFVPSNMTIAL
jgi:hypothetical protein